MYKQNLTFKLIILSLGYLLIQACEGEDNAFDRYLTYTENHSFQGSVLIAEKGEVLFHGQTKDIEPDRPFYIASLSKTFTATAIAKLAEQGQLHIDDPITQYLQVSQSDKKSITVQQLLSHTSGISSFGWDAKTNDWQLLSKTETITGILDQPLTASPGEKFQYNNANYILLSAIVESVTNSTFQEYVTENILSPAGMSHTYFGLTLQEGIEIQDNYTLNQKLPNYTSRPQSWLRVGGGDMISTLTDLNSFVNAMSEGKVLNREWLNKIMKPLYDFEPNYGYGFGWHIRTGSNGNRVLFHTGSFGGYNCELRWYPESQRSVAVFSNNEYPDVATERISNQLVQISRDHNAFKSLHYSIPSQQQREKLSGEFKNSKGGHININNFGEHTYLSVSASELRSAIRGSDENTFLEQSDSLSNLFLTDIKKDISSAFAKFIPEPDKSYLQEYVDEWETFMPSSPFVVKKIESIQLTASITRTYLSVEKQGRTYDFGLTWESKKLIGTAPNQKLQALVLTLVAKEGQLYAFDWATESYFKCSLEIKNDSLHFKIALNATTLSFSRAIGP